MSSSRAFLCLVAALSFFPAGCKHIQPLDTKPLDAAGVDYAAIKKLEALNITSEEVAEISKMRGGGFSDDACVNIVQIYHQRGKPFTVGETVAGLARASLSESTILELAKMDQLGLGAGEFEVMRLAGLSDAIILETAKHQADGKPTLTGLSLGRLKNSGLRESTLFELARRGIPDSAADQIIASRRGRHRATDAEILRRYTGS
ncbi:MAG: hypothetical protein ACRD59_06980 [Candidatus Acidiferrales bacterium]